MRKTTRRGTWVVGNDDGLRADDAVVAMGTGRTRETVAGQGAPS